MLPGNHKTKDCLLTSKHTKIKNVRETMWSCPESVFIQREICLLDENYRPKYYSTKISIKLLAQVMYELPAVAFWNLFDVRAKDTGQVWTDGIQLSMHWTLVHVHLCMLRQFVGNERIF